MLKMIHLQNFKGHRDTNLTFDDSRLQAIVGQNSTGKSSLLQGIHLLSQLFSASFRDVFEGEQSPQFLTSYGRVKTSIDAIISESGRREDRYGLSWHGHNSMLTPMLFYNSTRLTFKQGLSFEHSSRLKNAIYLKLSTNNLVKPAYSEETIPDLQSDGAGLAPFLDYIRAEFPGKLEELENNLRQIVPTVNSIHIKRAKVPIKRPRSVQVDGHTMSYEDTQEMMGQGLTLNMRSGQQIPAHAVSEGTMLTLGLLASLISPKKPNILLLDDIEQGLHPKAQIDLIKLLKKILDENPNLQIVFTTHSPYILDELETSQVHVLHLDEEGYTVAKRLDEHTNSSWAFDELTTGEFWDAEGEEWVLEEREKEVAVDG